jgi:hypothetical protein
MTKRLTARAALLLSIAAIAVLGTAASALAAPVWSLTSTSNTTAAPGGTVAYHLDAQNVGDEVIGFSDEITLTATLPPGLEGLTSYGNFDVECPGISGATVIVCTGHIHLDQYSSEGITIVAAVAPGASGVRTAGFQIEGGPPLTAPDATVDPVTISPTPTSFGIDAFDTLAADPAGDPLAQAGAHPHDFTTTIDFNTHTDPSPSVGDLDPPEDAREIAADLPPGFLGSAAATSARCTIVDLAHVAADDSPATQCKSESQIGTITLRHGARSTDLEGTPIVLGPLPVFNMVPPPSVPARFGFTAAKQLVMIDSKPRADGDYGLTSGVTSTPEAIALVGSTLTLWGVPSDPSHKPDRACEGDVAPLVGGETCESTDPPTPLFRLPTSCTKAGEGLPTTLRADSWQHPGVYAHKTIFSHQDPGYPYPEEEGPEGAMTRVWGPEVGTEGCEEVPFEPSISVDTTTNSADSPTGLEVDLSVPQGCWDAKATVQEAEAAICQSDLRNAVVTLPQGMSVNPSSAGGLAACSPAQVGLTTPVGQASPIHFDEEQVSCPDASKIGSVEIESPLIEDNLKGFVYLAQQSQNPFGSLLAIYLVAEGVGVVVKQAGEISTDPNTGRLTTTFTEAPQLPFSHLHLDLYGGQRAALRTPGCGTHAVTGQMTPWSGNPPAGVSDSFQVTQGCNGDFDPKLSAGVQNPLAGKTSPFSLRLSRDDGTQELGGLQVTLPPGLSGYLKGIPYCPDSALAAVSGNLGAGIGQEASPSCPAASQIGTLTVGAGAGVNPFFTSSGRVYLAGPYKGAPLSIAVIAPAVAGPFDLGSVVVRNALRIDPETAQITVDSDPFPTILHGIPLDLRDVRVNVNRDHFTLNPTSCEALSVDATIASAQGASAQRQNRFQVAGCDRLGFKPRLGLKLRGGTKRGDNPALTAVFRPRLGNANASRVQVALPHSEFLDQAHIRTICTRVQFAADQCPKGSIYGKVTATTPILDQPLTGNVYLRSSNHNLPDLVLALRGPASQPIEIDAVGRIDSVHGGIRTTFAQVPDAPLTKVVLRMQGGKKSLLQNSRDICARSYRADVQMEAHSGRRVDSRPPLRARCGGARHAQRSGGAGRG